MVPVLEPLFLDLVPVPGFNLLLEYLIVIYRLFTRPIYKLYTWRLRVD